MPEDMVVPPDQRSLQVQVAPLPEPARLQPLWQELEARADPSYFQSWAWIGPWLRRICPARIARLLTVTHDGRLVGLGVITERWRLHGLGPLHLRLHETGDQVLDSITVEHNGLLSAAGFEREALAAAVHHFATHDPRWLTLHLPGVPDRHLPVDGFGLAGMDERDVVRPSHHVDLSALRAAQGDYVASLRSAKTRKSIRLTERRLIAQHGEIALRPAVGMNERLQFFHELVALHQKHWSEQRRQRGSFFDARILRFHEDMIAAASDDTGPQLLRLSAGDTTIGYNYALAWRGVMYGYQFGIDYARYGHGGSPGLLAVALTAQHALQRGYSRYELMAGGARYKHVLGVEADRMHWLALDRHGWQSSLRKTWHALRRQPPA